MNIYNCLPLCSALVPHGYTEVGSVPVARPGRRLYNVRNPSASRSDSVLVQIDATEGNKVITLRSPLQVLCDHVCPLGVPGRIQSFSWVREVQWNFLGISDDSGVNGQVNQLLFLPGSVTVVYFKWLEKQFYLFIF